MNRVKYTFYIIKSLVQPKILKTGRVPYLGLEQTIHVIRPNLPRETVSLNHFYCEIKNK
jgi:hypothetical protein